MNRRQPYLYNRFTLPPNVPIKALFVQMPILFVTQALSPRIIIFRFNEIFISEFLF